MVVYERKMIKNKVCLLAAFFWPVSGDVEDYPYNIARILKESKQNFLVQTPNVWPDGKKIKRPLEDSFRGIPIQRRKSYFNLTWFAKFWFPEIRGYSVIHCCGYRHPHMFFSFFSKGKAKFFLSPFYPMHPRKNPLLNLIVWLIDKTLGKYIIRNCNCCFAETKQEMNWLRKMGAKKVVLLPNSLPKEAFLKGNQKKFRKKYKIGNKKMIFTLGRHVPIKNFEEIISIMKNIDAVLVIGGAHTRYTKKCMDFAKKIGVDKKIIWPGFMNQKDKRDAYTACDLFVLTSKRESLGTVVIEAMAQGKPVIATNAGGIPEIVPAKFCLYNVGDKRELTKKIMILLKDKKLSLEIGERGRKIAQYFRFENMKKVYLNTLNLFTK
jgi:glycosyltransferase involved in cell wall biosynthesis